MHGPLPIDAALDYTAQICDALDAAHSAGIVHRDIKPENILLTRHGVKLLDFGLAKVAHSAVDVDDRTLTATLTTTGQIVGTLSYMSPEQLQAKTVDSRSDIFAVRLVLYELINGSVSLRQLAGKKRPGESRGRGEHRPKLPTREATIP